MATLRLLFLLFSPSLACIPTSTPEGRPGIETTTSATLLSTESTEDPTSDSTTNAPMCPDPSYELNPANNFCYFVLPGSATAAEPDCQSHGAHAASVADQDESDWIIAYLIMVNNDATVYLGGFSTGPPEDESTWSWYDGTPFTFTNWETAGIPSANPGFDCTTVEVFTGSQGGWDNRPCDDNTPRLCKIAAV